MHRATRPAALMLSLLVTGAALPVRAAGLRASQVTPVMTATSGEVQLTLRHTSQLDNPVLADRTGAQEPRAAQSSTATTTGTGATAQGSSGPTIETIQLGEVSGTICDCGEIPILGGGGGFPLGFFPLFALGAVPLAFIDFGGEETETITRVAPPEVPVPVPTPAPTPSTPVPEPATLLLLGTGLAACGARARRRRQTEEAEAAEVVAQTAGEEV